MKNNTEVKKINGVPTFFLNEQPYGIPVMETYLPEEYYFRQFSAAGCEVFSFNTNSANDDYGHSAPIWPEKDRLDFSEFDRRTENILRHSPNALIMPRVMIGTPEWWMSENPSEYMIMSDGTTQFTTQTSFLNTYPTGRSFPSIASEKWRDFMAEGLGHLIDHIEKKYPDNFFGFLFSGMHTEEWYHWCCNTPARSDYSIHMKNAFREWLFAKYRTNEALTAAWQKNITFDQIEIPVQLEREDKSSGIFRDTNRQMNVIDFYIFYNEIIPETIDCFAKAAKHRMSGKKVIGAFYAYMYEFFGDPEFGHNAFGRYNESKHLDFVFVTASYDGRPRGTGSDYFRAPAYSALLHDKLWYHDNDVASFLARGIWVPERGFSKEQAENNCKVLGVTDNSAQSIDMYRRSAGFALGNGIFESYFDLHGGFFDHPDLMKEVSSLNRVFERSVVFDRSSNAEILIIADEESCSYTSYKSEMLSAALHDVQVELTKIGAASDHILLRDIGLLDTSHLDRYKLVILLNCYAMDDSARMLFDRKLKSSNRIILFGYASGLFCNGVRKTENMQRLTGISFSDGDKSVSAITLTDKGEKIFGEDTSKSENVNNFLLDEIYTDDESAEILGVNVNKRGVFALKRNQNFTAVYRQSPDLSGKFVRNLAKMAGVHIVNDFDDVLYVNNSYLTLHASSDGVRILKFKEPVCIYDAMTESELGRNVKEYRFDTKFGQTDIFRYEAYHEKSLDNLKGQNNYD